MNVCLTQPSSIAVNSDSQRHFLTFGVDKSRQYQYNILVSLAGGKSLGYLV